MWPFSVAVDGGKWSEINSYVRPGIDVSCLLRMAFSSVVLGGEHNIWCRYCASSAGLFVGYMVVTLFITSVGMLCGFSVGVLVWSLTGIIQSPVLVHFLPTNTVLPRYRTVHAIFVNSTVHPALHNLTTDNSECDAKPGIMWAIRAFLGRVGRLMSHVWEEDTYPPSGSRTLNGVSSIRLFVVGVAVTKK